MPAPSEAKSTFSQLCTTSARQLSTNRVSDEIDIELREKEQRGAPLSYISFSVKLTIGNVFISAAGSLTYCLSMAGISDAIDSTQQQGQANTTGIGGVDWDTIQSYNVPYLLFYYLYNPRAGFPLIQVPLLGHLLVVQRHGNQGCHVRGGDSKLYYTSCLDGVWIKIKKVWINPNKSMH